MTSRPELAIIKYILIYNNYNKYIRYINIHKELKELVILYHTLELLHQKFPDTDKTIDDLEMMVLTAYPNMREFEREAIASLLTELRSVEIKPDMVEGLLKSLMMQNEARNLASLALDVSEGRVDSGRLITALERFKTSSDKGETTFKRNFVTSSLDELEEHTLTGKGLHWRLKTLNESLGPLRDGDFGFVFARPETGKTTFLASEITFMAEQADRPVIWFNNEEQGEKVRLRTYQASLGLPLDDLWKHKLRNQSNYLERTKGNLLIYDDATIYRRDVEQIVAEMKPSVVIFDQIDKIKGFDADRQDLVFGKIYQWARELAKGGCAVIGICQSDGTGEGVKWLTMSHVAEAKTSKQAEADWILGIGRSNDYGTEDIRYFNISKNKLLGDKNTDPGQRHGRFEVYIRPLIARYEDLT